VDLRILTVIPNLTPATFKLAQRIREEFDETPGLQVNVAEGARFWALDSPTCACVLTHLHESGFLILARDGRYRRAQII
jgi:hypothetical protein